MQLTPELQETLRMALVYARANADDIRESFDDLSFSEGDVEALAKELGVEL